ncbi:MAG: hypothetical protein VCA55_01240 [Verrucomicrobiales bacterium]
MQERLHIIALMLLAAISSSAAQQAENPTSSELHNGDLLIGDFEEKEIGKMRSWGWTFEGDAFNRDFRHGTQQMRTRTGRYNGRWFLTSFSENLNSTGTLTSPVFTITRPIVKFLISGGSSPETLVANLLIDSEVVRSASGKNNDQFELVAFDVTEFVGQKSQFQVVDRVKGILGHINIDHVVQSGDANSARRIIKQRPVVADNGIGFLQLLDSAKRFAGPFTLADGEIMGKDGNKAAFDNTLLLATANAKTIISGSITHLGDALILKNGEQWFGQIEGLEDEKVTLNSVHLGKHSVELSKISSLHFNHWKNGIREGEPGTMYRENGEPLQGKLVWIRANDIAINCSLGVVPIPRAGVLSHILSKEESGQPVNGDELSLTDGSKLHGKTRIVGNQLMVEHKILGELKFGLEKILSLRRRLDNVTWISDLKADSLKSSGPLLPPPSPQQIIDDNTSTHSLRVAPNSEITYRVPQLGSGTLHFRATACPGSANRGAASISASSSGVQVTRIIKPDDKPLAVEVPLKPGATLQLAVNFTGPLAFPCNIDWRDAHFVSLTGANAQSQPEPRGN